MMEETTTFSSDLAVNATRHKYFLKKLHELGISQQRVSEWSLHRYLHFWLPLVYSLNNEETDNAQQQSQLLLPPPDIAWLWHVHRLAPQHYIPYCKKHFNGQILESSPPFVLQWDRGDDNKEQQPNPESDVDDAASTTRALWNSLYPFEGFFLRPIVLDKNTSSTPGAMVGNGDDFDLIESGFRQASFLWQISGDRYDDYDFLEEGVTNYLRFLQMKPYATKTNISMIVPTLQIDFIWHTHMLTNTRQYVKDCIKIMGKMLTHDDTESDRTEGGILETNYHATAKLWKDVYDGQDYYVEGGMYRGEPPEGFYNTDWNSMTTSDIRADVALNMIQHIGHVVPVMGASSVSIDNSNKQNKTTTAEYSSVPAQRRCWAIPSALGKTSDGSMAFISAKAKITRVELKALPKRTDYVLFKGPEGIGYYHIETQEAVRELARRCHRHIAQLESSIACDEACCGNKAQIKKRYAEVEEMRLVTAIMDARSNAPWLDCESKEVDDILNRMKRSNANDNISSSSNWNNNKSTSDPSMYHANGGVWLYPPVVYSTAGGACGGGVMTSGAACGGSACGM
jgi:hypothetical protein